MNNQVIEEMKKYFAAGPIMDIDAFDRIYHPSFENIRMDENGNCITLTKEQFMSRFRQMKATNQSLSPANEDTTYIGTTDFAPYCSLLLKRIKQDVPVLYNFVWKQEEGEWFIIREFTVEKNISYLIKMIEDAKVQ